MKILMVDDSDITRELMRTFLQDMGHQVVGEAENGNEAVEAFTNLKPDLVLMDLVMPGKTGLEALQEIIAADPSAKVVMVTAVQQDAMSQELLAKGAIAVLRKPFSYPELEEALKPFS